MAKNSVTDIHIIWMTSGLSCDGDSVAMTGAVNSSLEDIALGALPGMPTVHIHSPVISWWYKAEKGELDQFVLILEGSVPNEEAIKDTGGHWAAMGVTGPFGDPVTTNEWLDQLAPKAAAVVAVGTCATYGGIPAMKNNATGAMGLPDYLDGNLSRRPGYLLFVFPVVLHSLIIQPKHFYILFFNWLAKRQ